MDKTKTNGKKGEKKDRGVTSGRRIILVPAVLGENQKIIMPAKIFVVNDSQSSSEKK